MQNIAKENNFSETAFVLKEGKVYRLRWFTPGGEIDFCGHATLAAAFVLFNYYEQDLKMITFNTLSGTLTVNKIDDKYEMDFPSYNLSEIPVTDDMEKAIGVRPLEAYLDRDLLLVFESEETVKQLMPNQSELKRLDGLCCAVTAKGKKYDCVSRVFAPKLNVAEDPVTGSTHCIIVPYWTKRLGKNKITAYQASQRGGIIYCEMNGSRVKMSGDAVLFGVADILEQA